jgi:hypothetical protein
VHEVAIQGFTQGEFRQFETYLLRMKESLE